MDYLKGLHYDVYLLQDTHLTEEKTCYFNTVWRGACYHACGTQNSRGTSILLHPKTPHKFIHEEHCLEGNYTILVCEIYSNIYTMVSLYGPNDDSPAFFSNLGKKLDELSAENLVIGGDFNFVMDYRRDSNYRRQNNPRARSAFADTVEEQDLIDVWKVMNPNKQAFTWTKLNPHKFGRLDMLFISEHLLPLTVSCEIRPGYRSDHSIVTLHLNAIQKKKGPGLWKFNESLLYDENYVVLIKELVVSTVKEYAVPIYSENYVSDYKNFDSIQVTISHSLFYETLLMLIRGETVKFSKRKAESLEKKKKNRMKKLFV